MPAEVWHPAAGFFHTCCSTHCPKSRRAAAKVPGSIPSAPVRKCSCQSCKHGPPTSAFHAGINFSNGPSQMGFHYSSCSQNLTALSPRIGLEAQTKPAGQARRAGSNEWKIDRIVGMRVSRSRCQLWGSSPCALACSGS